MGTVLLNKDSNLKDTGIMRVKKKGCFRGALEGKNLESNLQGHPVSVKE